jgi:hypothetical protein
MAADIELIWCFGKPEYFFEKGWTGRRAANEVICPSGRRQKLTEIRAGTVAGLSLSKLAIWHMPLA